MKIAFILALQALLLLLGSTFAEQLYRLPGASLMQADDGTVRVTYREVSLSYVPGVGWYPRDLGPAPQLVGRDVYVSDGVLDELGVTTPRLKGVRSSHGEAVRLVLDLVDLPSMSALDRLSAEGELTGGEPLSLTLPRLLLPKDISSGVAGIDLEVDAGLLDVTVTLTGPSMAYRVFSLDDPQRLVIDLTLKRPLPAAPAAQPAPSPGDVSGAPGDARAATQDAAAIDRDQDTHDQAPNLGAPTQSLAPDSGLPGAQQLDSLVPDPFELPVDTIRTLHDSVTHRQTWIAVPDGRSRVDVLKIRPQAGEFRVVGESFAPRTLDQLASGGIAAINASYFDTRDHQSIGLLTIDYSMLSLPSRGRASIGFGPGGLIIDRVRVDLAVTVEGHQVFRGILDDDIVIHTKAGAEVGSPTRGALVVNDGTVIENRIGPRRVPEDGMVLVYDPELRALAVPDAGDSLSISARLLPEPFNRVRYAVEAGPLLVANGQPAFNPELESFNIEDPQSNVNRRASRAAVGVRRDGTVLFVTATNMTAAELVPVMMSLGAVDALQMDSGGSSTLYGVGTVINRPAATQRAIPTAIVFVPERR